MNLIEKKFAELKSKGHKALISYLTAGFPDVATSFQVMRATQQWGSDLLEIGVPFSDPIADGPVIQHASYQSLKQGITLTEIFLLCQKLNKELTIPYLLMSYYNPIYQYGLRNFARDCRNSGVSGVIVPDLSLEESEDLQSILRQEKIHLIYFITPFTPISRMKQIIRKATGFLYIISVAGVTGERKGFDPKLVRCLETVGRLTTLPQAVGFGVSKAEQVRALSRKADGVIVGSYFVRKMADGKISELERAMREFSQIVHVYG
ncbi:MAG: tryptophan synthase subunit alpha [Candidatus Omnitrophica bacterium]|nr:tryptophan synthase subunit alpha [Candidatus Omnitrophota bacterium]